MGEFIHSTWGQVPALWQAVIWSLVKVIIVLIPLVLAVAYYTYAERKVIGAAQSRMGPNVVGYRGLLQPFADVGKLLLKEVIRPAPSDRYLFFVAPVLAFAPAIAAWAVVPFGQGLVIANINVAVLYFLAMTSLGVYGIILAGWASNSKYAFLGAMRSAAQVVSYELAMSFCVVGVLMASRSMNLGEIVEAQQGNFFTWYWLPLLPLFVIYFVSGVAETNRAPFDLAEGESELVAGFHVEYSGMAFALFFLAEYANMILISALASVLFMGGWLSPFQNVPALGPAFAWVPGIIWMLLKTGFFMFCFLWFRATFPRYRYDQVMRLGWKVFIPLTLVWLVVEAIMILGHLSPWFT